MTSSTQAYTAKVPARSSAARRLSACLLAVSMLFATGHASAGLLSGTLKIAQNLVTQVNTTVEGVTDTVDEVTELVSEATEPLLTPVVGLLPVQVDVSGNTATVNIGVLGQTLAEMTLNFSDVRNLQASNLGVSAEIVGLSDPNLLSRLTDPLLTPITSLLPILITVEPPATGGLNFDRTVRAEVHTALLAYTAGSRYRLFKAPLGGEFRDITDEVAPGSVRARGTTSGFSQFLILLDLRPTGLVIAQKTQWLRNRIDSLPAGVRDDYASHLDVAEDALANGDYSGALIALDMIRANASAQAGNELSQQWAAGGALDNQAGDLIAGVATLKFSIEYLRDYGQ